ncbi:MAG: hypothetical protein ISR65_05505 [Bacteriovoracaceae bacterium]|nr:hypothetical protein [Bacteriovoracaceae bacterium]
MKKRLIIFMVFCCFGASTVFGALLSTKEAKVAVAVCEKSAPGFKATKSKQDSVIFKVKMKKAKSSVKCKVKINIDEGITVDYVKLKPSKATGYKKQTLPDGSKAKKKLSELSDVAKQACIKTSKGFLVNKFKKDSFTYKVSLKKGKEKIKCKVRLNKDLGTKYVKHKTKKSKKYIEVKL